MATKVNLQYGVNFGAGDSTEPIDWKIELDGDAEKEYLRVKKLRLPFSDFPALAKDVAVAVADSMGIDWKEF